MEETEDPRPLPGSRLPLARRDPRRTSVATSRARSKRS